MAEPTSTRRFDVAIVGGGPSGAATAIVLARRGYRVALIERCGVPRARQAEALAPAAATLLDGLDLAGALDRACVFAPETTTLRWRDDVETIERSSSRTTIVDRRVFDEALLEHATRVGVNVFRPLRALRPFVRESTWVLPFDGESDSNALASTFLVDASGRASYLRTRSLRRGVPTTALHAVFAGSKRPFDDMRVEAGDRTWIWGVPCGPDRVTVVAFVDRNEASGITTSARAALFKALLGESELFRRCLSAQSSSQIGAGDATFAVEADPVGWTSLKVGDAALAFDPLSSQGLQNALRGALHAGACIHTLLGGGGDPSAALDFYRAVHRRTSTDHARACAALYAQVKRYGATPFFRSRAPTLANAEPLEQTPPVTITTDRLLQLSREARIGKVAAMDDGIVKWVEGLNHPRLAAPVAYLNGHPAGPLVSALLEPATLATSIRQWAPNVPRHDARRTLQWLIQKRVLVPVADL